MNNYNSLEEIFNKIDQSDYKIDELSEVSDLFRQFVDKALQQKHKGEAVLAQRNCEFLDFNITENKLHPIFSDYSKNDVVAEYPSLKKFDEETYQQLIKRYEVTRNPYLKLHYSHLLWLTPKKHKKYAVTAIENYFKIIPEIHQQVLNSSANISLKLTHHLKNLYYLSKQIKYSFNESSKYLYSYIKKIHFTLINEYRIKLEIGNLVLNEKKYFKNLIKTKIENKFYDLHRKLLNENEYWPAIDMLVIGQKFIEQSSDKIKWFNKIGSIYELLIKMNSSELAAIDFCQKAIHYYKSSGNDKKVTQLEKANKKLTEKLPMNGVPLGIDLSKTLESIEKEAKRIANDFSFEEIIIFLATDKFILPNKTDMEKAADDMMQKSVFLTLIDSAFHDLRGNVVKNIGREDKGKEFLISNYMLQLNNLKLPFIHWIIYYSTLNSKITTTSLVTLFQKKSWFGKNLERKVFNKRLVYNWLDVIMPSIHDYLFHLKLLENGYNYFPNYVTPIDSLTLKIEGLLRDFLSIQEVPTTKQIKGKHGLTTEELDINDFLYHSKIKELFDEDDLLFLRILFIEKTGINLRNEVAHSLLLPQQYSVEFMHLLFIALLKIGQFDISKENR
ncbi:MAG: DUF4209 domain-containing protein [Melioribacteraceae bacterium]|nr:DUF4209 domain-containing protein [Melioribacteraceae bacterium]MCF8353900.1 DUF4209 domain-containing protein [Melioribacteraceae bacterium]MCF8392657.1 DUF4209 domain-containing protein [Melioribacteraceae bacterium]MCF8417678.1 DUF4209 domain-containing protein [Melioribacteraceae bacterium]